VTAFRIISAEKARFPVSVMCELLDVNRASFYAWERRPPSDRALSDAWLTEQIREIWETNRKVYGSRRVRAELRLGRGIKVSRKRVERLMREAHISGLIRKRRRGTTIRVPGVRVADDLVKRGFRPAAANVLWCADITYLETWQGRCYLAAIQDLYSRMVVGWQLAEHMRSELVVDALQMAIHRRRPQAGLVHHSDQGSQYVSLAFGQAARDAGIAVSMGSRGDCFDNAVAESFFSTVKKEFIRRESPFATRADLRLSLFDYIESFYNRQRRHSTLGYLSPEQYEKINLSQSRKTGRT
jgi:putative transposase